MHMPIKRHTIHLDAAGMAPGRLATRIAMVLMGKHKPDFTPHMDTGDKVEVINVAEIKFSGKKIDQKLYRHHSNHPGGLKEIPAKLVMENPAELMRLTVMKMLPKNKLRDLRLRRLKFKSK